MENESIDATSVVVRVRKLLDTGLAISRSPGISEIGSDLKIT